MISSFPGLIKNVNALRSRERKRPLTQQQVRMIREQFDAHSRGEHFSVLKDD